MLNLNAQEFASLPLEHTKKIKVKESVIKLKAPAKFDSNVSENFFLSEIPTTSITTPLFHSKPFNFMRDQNKKVNPFLFKADINPFFRFAHSPESSFAIFAVPRIRIRQFNKSNQYYSFSPNPDDNSFPVRTPSLMVSVFYFQRIAGNKELELEQNDDEYQETFFFGKDYKRQLFSILSFNHHSNGQDGASRDDLTEFDHPDRIFNVINGSFAKNLYSEIGIGLTTMKSLENKKKIWYNLNFFFNKEKTEAKAYWKKDVSRYFIETSSHSLKFEYQVLDLPNALKTYVPKNVLTYKFTHNIFNIGYLNADYNEIQRLEVLINFATDNELILTENDFKRRFNIDLKYHWKIPFSQQANFVLNYGYKGMDDYNIFFEDNYSYFNFGLSIFNSGLNFTR